jgi:hypothetical protein
VGIGFERCVGLIDICGALICCIGLLGPGI